MASPTKLALTQINARLASENAELRAQLSVLTGKVEHLEHKLKNFNTSAELGIAIDACAKLRAENEALKAKHEALQAPRTNAPIRPSTSDKPVISHTRALLQAARELAMTLGTQVRVRDGQLESYSNREWRAVPRGVR